MNGAEMWFFWSAFVAACLRLGHSPAVWTWIGRAILVGLLNDGHFRRRFEVRGAQP